MWYTWKWKVQEYLSKTKSYLGLSKRIYCDIGGAITPEGLNGEKYYHNTDVYPFRAKCEAKVFLMQYINRMKTNCTCVMNIRPDNGGEFNSSDHTRVHM